MPPDSYSKLRHFIAEEMRMSHVYQPVMLKVILENGGRASQRSIAQAFVTEDRSQLEYYERIVRDMPGRVLARRGITERVGDDYRLVDQFNDLTPDQRRLLIVECESRLHHYLEQRGLAPWQHRKKAKGYIPGSLRYDVLRRAKGRCEACGVSHEERALEVDHIVPRNRGGSDDISNLQALCFRCNAQKRDRDDTDFAAVKASYGHRQDGCAFCDIPKDRLVAENELAVVITDRFPVTEGHRLVVPRRHVGDYFDLYQPERNAIDDLLHLCRDQAVKGDPTVAGFNVGANIGEPAGQTVFHVHVHLIPRRAGDVANPRGGVRGVIPARQDYGSGHP